MHVIMLLLKGLTPFAGTRQRARDPHSMLMQAPCIPTVRVVWLLLPAGSRNHPQRVAAEGR